MHRRHGGDPDFKALKARLESRRAALREEILTNPAAIGIETYAAIAGQVHDRGEESQADLLVDVDYAGVERDLNEAQDVDEALVRMRSGGYGHCLDCEKPIPLERLEAYPTAKRCWACQERYERSHAGQRVASDSAFDAAFISQWA